VDRQSHRRQRDFSTEYILHDQSLALGWTASPTSSLVNTAHFGFLRDFSHSDPVGLQIGVSDASQFGLTGIPVSPESAGIPANYVFGLTTIGTAIYRPQFQVAQVFQAIDDVYKLIGKHSLQFGYEYHENSLNFFDLEAPQGAILAEGTTQTHRDSASATTCWAISQKRFSKTRSR